MRHIDPTGRALHVSVGCALFNPRAVAAHFGWEPVSRLPPCPVQPDLLATVRLAGASRTSVSPAPYEAVWRRHSSRFPFSDRALPARCPPPWSRNSATPRVPTVPISTPCPPRT